ncbi:MAG: acyltransferase [Puia sp.]|nr:acyltransferase [Puia sp.]
MKHRFAVLDVFRGIFASLVFLFHLKAFSDTPVLNNAFINHSDIFVDFFFVLSGFVICYTYQAISDPRELMLFYKKRFLRLYPLHFVMLLVFVLIELSKTFFAGHVQIHQIDNPNNNIISFLSNLFLLNSVRMPGVTDVSWNIPSWSISAEWIAYLLFAGITFYVNRSGLSKYKNGVYIGVSVLALILLYGITGGFRLTYSFDYGFLRGISGFFLGAFCFNVFSYSRPYFLKLKSSFYTVAEVALLTLMIIMVTLGETLKEYGFVFEVLFFISVLIFAFEGGIISNLLKKSPLLQRIGTYSYSIYMTHAFLISLVNIVFIRLLKFSPASYGYLFILNYYIIYKVSQFTYKNIELRFNYKKKTAPKHEVGVSNPEEYRTP